ncbi:MAG: DUF1456 family protein [Candidatus Omnitrophica bacterium]|nr:DUF1456 family protein [Candidatus Omnitrophota bacterium]
MTNNDILKKLRVALMFRDSDIVEILKLADFETSEAELSAFFRREDQPNYRPCGDQLLRRFLDGLIIRNRGKMERRGPVSDRALVQKPDQDSHRVARPVMEKVAKFQRGPRPK